MGGAGTRLAGGLCCQLTGPRATGRPDTRQAEGAPETSTTEGPRALKPHHSLHPKQDSSPPSLSGSPGLSTQHPWALHPSPPHQRPQTQPRCQHPSLQAPPPSTVHSPGGLDGDGEQVRLGAAGARGSPGPHVVTHVCPRQRAAVWEDQRAGRELRAASESGLTPGIWGGQLVPRGPAPLRAGVRARWRAAGCGKLFHAIAIIALEEGGGVRAPVPASAS